MRSLLNEKNVVYILIYCWPYFKELMELEIWTISFNLINSFSALHAGFAGFILYIGQQ